MSRENRVEFRESDPRLDDAREVSGLVLEHAIEAGCRKNEIATGSIKRDSHSRLPGFSQCE